ncbi:raffinose/stachyose/melibiose transport system permease protein [Streptomyces aidingensis]|uniref:Raffinose/stachyose/melibiose transport system permease protein n=2 Tax=Streptomyces aidingensis TaxID=910347 RepID=A0A1I1UYF2_9ACTN|nr:raffinose/stachyose/melibiose transport system permease protein [Streptomyces aidingensis]
MTPPVMTGERSAAAGGGHARVRKSRTSTGSAARNRSRRRGTIALFMAPALLLYTLLVLVPVALAIYFSWFKWNGFGGLPTDFIGFDNFTRMLEDPLFTGDLRRGGLLVVLSLLVQLPLSLGLALLLNQRMRGRALYRLLFFAPYVISEVITGVLFSLILSPQDGLFNQILGSVGLESWQKAWLAEPDTVMIALFVVITWRFFGFHTILYLAGRQSIPGELYEAASLDGASGWHQFRHITLPLLGPTIRISAFLSVIGTIQLFDLVWILTRGGPVHSSETLAVTMFDYGFQRYQIGYASAFSVAIFMISMVFALLYMRFVMRRDTAGALTTMGGRK